MSGVNVDRDGWTGMALLRAGRARGGPVDRGPATRAIMWSGWRDLNPRPSVPQTDALTKLRHSPFGGVMLPAGGGGADSGRGLGSEEECDALDGPPAQVDDRGGQEQPEVPRDLGLVLPAVLLVRTLSHRSLLRRGVADRAAPLRIQAVGREVPPAGVAPGHAFRLAG